MKRILTVLLVLSILTLSVTTIYAADGGVMLASSGFEKQEKSNWCWVACARNSVHHETSNHRTPKAAVRHIKGSLLDWYPDEAGSITEIEEAAEYISKNKESYTGLNAVYSFTGLKKEVDQKDATITCGGYYNSNNVRKGGHAVVVIGYYISGKDNCVIYHDPSNNVTYTCPFLEFCDGTYNGRRYDQTCYNNETN